MATTRTSNVFGITVEATSTLTFAVITDKTVVAGDNSSTFDVAVTQGVPAAVLAGNINVTQYSDSAGNTELSQSHAHDGIVMATAPDNFTVTVTIDPSGVANANAGTTYAQLSVSQPDPGD